MSNTEGQIIKVRIAGGSSTINEVFHDNTLKGTGQPGNELGVAESVLQDIASKVSDVQVNGESVVEEGVADITVGDATITIQKNGTDIDYFTANETTDKTINVEVPTTLRELSTVAEQNALDSGITSADVEQITTNKNNIATANGEINTINSKIPSTASSENKLTDKDYVDGEISSLDGDITDINSKIPAQASAENKLADKNFVNSSIATNTANFIGTFDSVEELEAYSGTVTNNDYAFVVSEDSAGNTVYNRYKYTTATTPASWVFEYELNNSSFTADQWSAINSGATTTNIGQIATNTSTISGHIADKNNPHQVTKAQVGLGNVDNTSDTNKPVSTAQQTALNAKANVALDNLTNVGKNIANWSSNVSNCIVEIPQDIKLELSNGTLTLKSGSKVYVPNGDGVFDTVTTTQDLSTTISTNGQFFIYKNPGNYINYQAITTSVSGTTDSLSGTPWHLWYDTTNNVINRYGADGTTAMPGQSLPIAVVTVSGGAISSIDQVFNGFGFIGSTIFALPNVKALIPNGRNTDGSLKNILKTVDTVKTVDLGGTWAKRFLVITNWSSTIGSVAVNYYYDEETNYVYHGDNGSVQPIAFVGELEAQGTKIAYLKVKTPFHAVDYNDYSNAVSQVSTNTSNISTLSSTKQDEATALNYNYISNCITEIPQDINLIENGDETLTLKAGSKLYVPNGAGVFDTYIVPNDINITPTAFDDTYVYFIAPNGTRLNTSETKSFSGPTAPTFYGNYALWYDTANNLVKYTSDAGSTWTPGYTLPFCIASCTANTSLNLKHIFNGFGYIGSTVFALPGISGLIPNGRNADGSLNNILTTPATTVSTSTAVSGNTGRKTMTINNIGVIDRPGGLEYNERENRNYNFGSRSGQCICGYFTVGSNYKITDFVIKTAFHAVDYNDTDFIGHQAMPSDRYVNLTLPSNGGTITAPADGYLFLNKTSGAAGERIAFFDSNTGPAVSEYSSDTDQYLQITLAVRSGQTLAINYSASGTTNSFRFIYANGSK